MPKSAAIMRASNIVALDYPLGASLASAMAICDEVVIAVGPSYDDTLSHVCRLRDVYDGGRINVIQREWSFDLMWQERVWNWSVAETDAEWLLWLDADEVIDPSHAQQLRGLMCDPAIKLLRFPFVHFYGSANYTAEFDLHHNTRMGRRSVGYRMINARSAANPKGPACAVVYDDEDGKPRSAHNDRAPGCVTVETIPILHYGWARDALALARSQMKQAAWYKDGAGLEDGHIPDIAPYDFEMAKQVGSGRVNRHTGSHPAIIQYWLDAHRERWQEVERAIG